MPAPKPLVTWILALAPLAVIALVGCFEPQPRTPMPDPLTDPVDTIARIFAEEASGNPYMAPVTVNAIVAVSRTAIVWRAATDLRSRPNRLEFAAIDAIQMQNDYEYPSPPEAIRIFLK